MCAAVSSYKIAIVWRGDRALRAAATPENNRYHRIFSELSALGIAAEPAVYVEEVEDEVRAQLMQVDGVLVWVNPLDGGRTREQLDELLRDVAAPGRFVSAHPDVILKMGVKEVLHRTRHLGWGTDTRLYRRREEFRDGFPAQLRGGSFAELAAPAIDLTPNSGPQRLGRQIARSLMAGLPRTAAAVGGPASATGSARHPSVTSTQHQTHEGVTT